MKPISIEQTAQFVSGKIISKGKDDLITGVSTDSRKLDKGSLFIALKGAKYDGHDYIKDAVEKGIKSFIVSQDVGTFEDCTIILVEDTLKALQDLAMNYREMFNIPVIAVTGSVGKTTTKDIISKVLSQKYNVLSTYGNMNNHIGLPMSILSIDDKTEIAVLEMGMSHFGEISLLSKIAKPTCGVITNIGMSHIGNLGSQENIMRAKFEILDGMKEPKKLYLNGDDPFLWGKKGHPNCEIAYCGIENKKADALAYDVKSDNKSCSFKCDLFQTGTSFYLNIPGEHNVYNALVALMIAKDFQIDEKSVICGLLDFIPFKMRMNIIENGGITLILDCYNASPASMNAAIGVLKKTPSKHKIAILGEMAELGSYADDSHLSVGKMVAYSKIDYLITLGDVAKWIEAGAKMGGMNPVNMFHFSSKEEIMKFTDTFIKSGDAVLIKASRSVGLEDIGLHIEERIR